MTSVVRPTVQSRDAHLAATTVDARIVELRRDGVTRAIRQLRMGHSSAACQWMFVTTERQARLAGLGTVKLPRREGLS